MDILGFAEMAKQAQKHDQEDEFLTRLYAALEQGRKWLELDKALPKFGEKDFYVLKAFTDNIVIGWPVRDDAESELGSAFSALAWFQLEMVNAGFFVRGAISVGNIYVDDIAVFGGALIEAHEGEAILAKDPRIILTASAAEATQLHLGYYGGGAHAPQNRDLFRDADGQLFLNYLDDTVLIAPDEAGPGYDMLDSHKQRVTERLTEHRSNPAIWNKYAWVARYHNYFCDLWPQYFDKNHKIDVRAFEMMPSQIVDATGR